MSTEASPVMSGPSTSLSNMDTKGTTGVLETGQGEWTDVQQIPRNASTLDGHLAAGRQEALSLAGAHLRHPSTEKAVVPDIVDLFSGCGGLSMGFQKAGFEILGAYDNWEHAVATYNLNHPDEQKVAEVLDLSDTDATIEELSKFSRPGESYPAIIGGPPCQDFSSAGKRVEGDRADLTEKFALIVEEFQPEFFLMENVSMAAKAGVYRRAIQHMRSLGYQVEPMVLDASRMGVPQRRKRLIAFGSKDHSLVARVLEAWEDNLESDPMTIRQYFREVENRELDFDHYYRHPRSYSRRGVFSVDEPSPTIRGVNRPIPRTYSGHPGNPVGVEGLRQLDTSERAQIQTFPADFKFNCSQTNAEQLIGNAVPVRMGEYLAVWIAAALKD